LPQAKMQDLIGKITKAKKRAKGMAQVPAEQA
jgi:hypothetical protein